MIGDKTLHCKHCDKDIFLPGNKVGGMWHLNAWENPVGIKFWGSYCSPCFDKIHHIKKSYWDDWKCPKCGSERWMWDKGHEDSMDQATCEDCNHKWEN